MEITAEFGSAKRWGVTPVAQLSRVESSSAPGIDEEIAVAADGIQDFKFLIDGR